MANVGARKRIRSAASYEQMDFLRLLRFFAANLSYTPQERFLCRVADSWSSARYLRTGLSF
jgi:hypothetical protein